MTILKAEDISKVYTIETQQIRVLDSLTLSIDDGEFIAIKGSSGSGKSTLLSLLSGLDRPTEGRIYIADTDITDLSEDDLAPLRNETIGFIFQSFHLIPSLSALENVMFPAELKHDPQAEAKAITLLDRVGLQARGSNFPHQLSGGEKQRVAICRALINNPKIVFADEPTGNLDSKNGQAILDLLLELQNEWDTTLILVTHNDAVADLADRIITLVDGKVA